MEPEVTDRQQWLMVDGPEGIEYVPSTVVRMPTNKELDDMRMKSMLDKPWRDYFSNSVAYQIKVVTGYGVRLDTTSWSVYTEKRRVQQALRNLEQENAR